MVALISGSTLLGFVGLVLYAVLAAVGVFAAGDLNAEGASDYGAGALTGSAAEGGHDYQRQTANVDGRSTSYLDFGSETPLGDDGSVSVAPIWVFIDGFGADGTPRMIPGHLTVLDVIPGDEGYSDLWDVQFVIVPEGFDSRAIRSLAQLRASGLETIPAGMLVNCPIVDGDAATSESHPVLDGWYRGERVHYFDLGVSSDEPGDVYEFVLSVTDDRGGEPARTPLAVPPIVVPPADSSAAQFFRLHRIEVTDAAVAAQIDSLADLEAFGLTATATGELVNRPLLGG